jgi:hypothetical protein
MDFKKVLLFVLLAQGYIAGVALYNYGITIDALQAVTRYSGRVSLLIFSIIFIFLPRDRDRLSSILSSQPFLIFAIAHGIHLVELLSYVYLSGSELIPIRLAGGFLAYILIFSQPFVQRYNELDELSNKKYLIVESIYLYYVWFIFFMSYLPRVQGKLPHVGGDYREFVVLLSWVCILLGMKLTSLFMIKKR